MMTITIIYFAISGVNFYKVIKVGRLGSINKCRSNNGETLHVAQQHKLKTENLPFVKANSSKNQAKN